jgi:DNA polymerase-1
MVQVPKVLVENSLSGDMLLQVHDELIFEVPEDEVEKTLKLVRQVMENACNPIIKLDVPLVVEAGIGNNWSDAH